MFFSDLFFRSKDARQGMNVRCRAKWRCLLPKCRHLFLIVLLAVHLSRALAANGTWTNNADGSWSTAGNWLGNNIPDGADGAADFSTINITGDRIVTLDSSHTIGSLKFGDVTLINHDWTLTNTSGSILTLRVSSGTPTIEVVNQTTTISLVLAGNQGFTKLGAGALTLGGALANTYTGTTIVSAGTLRFGKSASVDAFGGDLAINGGTVNYFGTTNDQLPDSANVTLNSGTLDFGARSETIGNASSGLGSFTMNGGSVLKGSGGTIVLDRNPTITGGTITLSAASGVITANQDLIFNGGTISFTSTSSSSTAALNLRNGGGISYQSVGTSTALVTNTGGGSARLSLNLSGATVFTVDDSTSVTTEMIIGVVISGGTNLFEKRGDGVLQFNAANTYSGATMISGGVLGVSTLANGGAASGVGDSTNSATSLILNGGTLRYTGGTASSDRLFSVGTSGGTLDASGSGKLALGNTGTMGFNNQSGARALTLTGNNTGDNTLAAAIGDNGGATTLTKNGSGTWVLSGNNTYTGGTTLSQGTLKLGADNALGSGGFIFAGGTLDANNHSASVGALSLTADSTLNLGNDETRQDLVFASASTYVGGTLDIAGWGGPDGSTYDRLIITADPNSSGILGHIQFSGYALGAAWDSATGEIVPVPEPINIALAVFGIAFAGFGFTRRFRAHPR